MVSLDWEKPREHHGLDIAVAGQRFRGATRCKRYRVTDLDLRHVLQPCHEIAHVADRKVGKRNLGWLAGTDLLDERFGTSGHHVDGIALFDRAVDDADQSDYSPVCIEIRIEDERAKRRIGIASRSWNVVDNGLEKVVDAHARLGRAEHGIIRRNCQSVLYLLACAVGIGCRQIDLVYERYDFKVGVHCHHGVRDGLRLDALGGVDDEHGAFAGGKASRYLVGEVDVTRSVD